MVEEIFTGNYIEFVLNWICFDRSVKLYKSHENCICNCIELFDSHLILAHFSIEG